MVNIVNTTVRLQNWLQRAGLCFSFHTISTAAEPYSLTYRYKLLIWAVFGTVKGVTQGHERGQEELCD